MLTIRSLRSCLHTAHRAVAARASAVPGSSVASIHSNELVCDALRIAAAHVTQQPACHSLIAYRWYSQAAALPEQQSADIHLTEAAVERIQELSQNDGALVLRLRVDAGGCSGFSYKFDLEGDPTPDDVVVHQQGVQLVTDSVSYELLKGATVDYTTDLIRASFEYLWEAALIPKNPKLYRDSEGWSNTLMLASRVKSAITGVITESYGT